MQGEKFETFLDDLSQQNAANTVSIQRQAVYREALEQTLSEVEGSSGLVRFACGETVCAGYTQSEGAADWFGKWQATLMQSQVAPIGTWGARQLAMPDGTTQSRFTFSTSPRGLAVVRREQY